MKVRSFLDQTFTEFNKSYNNLSTKYIKQCDYELFYIHISNI